MGIRMSILTTLAVTLIGTAPAWSQSLLKTLDPDNDGTLDKNEFLALVEKRFNAANPGNDGTIDAKEIKSAAGRSLVQLLK